MISLIAAHAANMVIGQDNKIPWHISEDFKHFKDITSGHPVIMGRNTYDSIIASLGSPLPNRQNIVVSRSMQPAKDVTVARNLKEALDAADNSEEIFIIGGAQLYKTALHQKLIDRMYITLIKEDIAGDVYFPSYNHAEWTNVEQRSSSSEDHEYDFITYDRNN